MQETEKVKSCWFCVMVATTGLHENKFPRWSVMESQRFAFFAFAAAAFDDSSADNDTACDADAAALMTSVAPGA